MAEHLWLSPYYEYPHKSIKECYFTKKPQHAVGVFDLMSMRLKHNNSLIHQRAITS